MNDLRERYDFLFDGSGDLTQETLLLYVFGPLENEARQAVEQHLTECEMCRDAAEGIALLGTKEQALAILALTDAKLTERVAALKQKVTRDGKEALINQTATVEPAKAKKPVRTIVWYRYAAAASVIVVVGIAFWLFNQNMVSESQDLAMNKEDSLGLFKEKERKKNVFEANEDIANDGQANSTGSASINEEMEPEGTVTSTDSGGTGPFTYMWDNNEPVGNTNAETGAGTYTVTSKNAPPVSNQNKEEDELITAQKPSAPAASAPAPPKKQKDAAPVPDLVMADEELEDVSEIDDSEYNGRLNSTLGDAKLKRSGSATDTITFADVSVSSTNGTFANSEPPVSLDKGTSNSNFTLNNASNLGGMDVSVNQAQYPGGMAEVQKYFDKLTYPQNTIAGYKGVIIFEVTFDAKGKITKSTIVKGVGKPYDDILLAHLNKMPNWEAPAPYGEPFASTRVITVEVTVR